MRSLLFSFVALAFALPAIAEPLGEPPQGLAEATFAGGCFWCVEEAMEQVEGVERAVSGYTGGNTEDPTYPEVSGGGTGHAEAVRVYYDPGVVGYRELLDVFWHNIDPTVRDRQFCDRGSEYRSAIFYHGEEQERLARETRRAIDESGRLPGPVVTQIEPAGPFYRAEDYHQNYYVTNSVRYQIYKRSCGRVRRLEELWGDKAG